MAIAPARLVEWPLRCGPVPPLADCHSTRPETGLGRIGKLDPGDTLILVPAPGVATPGLDDSAVGGPARPRPPPAALLTSSASGGSAYLSASGGSAYLSASGGTGKTQLAAALTHQLWDSRAVDLLTWVKASNRNAILTGYALTLAELGAADPGDDLLAAAQRFLAWLSRTERRWLVVLDDLADPADLDGLWPAGTDGRVVVTARRDGTLTAPNRRIAPVPAFSTREALAYLSARLATDPGQRTEALDLAHDLDCQPLGLAHATAALICTGASCRDYRGWYHDRKRRMSAASVPPGGSPDAMGLAGPDPAGPDPAGPDSSGLASPGPDSPGPGLDYAALGHTGVTWSLAMDLADQIPPADFARPALVLAALLDPAGIPGVVFTSPAACGYLTGHPAMPAEPAEARDAVHSLARAGLVTINPASTTRTVQVHPAIQAMTRGILPAPEFGARGPLRRRRADAVLARGSGSAPAGPGPAGLHDQPARVQRRSALDTGDPSGPGAGGPEPGQRRDQRPRPRLLAGDAGDQHPGARRGPYPDLPLP